MAFVIQTRNKAYFKRFQTKFRRRREGKTDYRARKRLVVQAKDKYNSPRFRFVVRFSNSYVLCQVIEAEITGDKVICSAHSKELKGYGVKAGFKNYPAAYCTGLLCARRLLASIKFQDEDDNEQTLDNLYEGNKLDGYIRSVKYGRRTLYVEDLEWESERRPFRCNLDVGIKATTLGARVFGALKGASDGGLDIPHNFKKFPGYDAGKKKYNARTHVGRICGVHIGQYMKFLQANDTAKFEAHFSEYIKNGVGPDDIGNMYQGAHDAIRADPSRKAIPADETHAVLKEKFAKQQTRKTLEQRRQSVKEKLAYKKWKEDEASESDSEEEEEDDE